MQQQPSEQSEASSLLNGNRELAVLYAIAGYLNRQVDVHDALQEVLAHVTQLLGLRTAWVWIFDDRGDPIVAASQHLPPYLADHPERMCGSCLCLDTYMEGTVEGPPISMCSAVAALKTLSAIAIPVLWVCASTPAYRSMRAQPYWA
ncbi:hypothetical protein [Dictyobacter kobayashii]|uniref:GAF domain-containing protein n=1 Tax=Dictyobacter kobayashii TaxID=2014872 RepID=A0A402AIA4_9CHLR|nr:hypothetical protein [Dictyobacter kobayashii]GCE18829.1 hypothetical protein KDK_26290 [Dictyobacter kobayashii]